MDILSQLTAAKRARESAVTEYRSALEAVEGATPTAEQSQEFDRREGELRDLQGHVARLERAAEAAGLATKREVADSEARRGSADDEHRALVASDEYRDAFLNVLFRSKRNDAEYRVLQAGVNADGGYTIPTSLDSSIQQYVHQFGVMEQLASVLTTGDGTPIDFVRGENHVVATWVDENEAATESTPSFSKTTLGQKHIAIHSKLSGVLLRDSRFDLEAYIASEFARAEADLVGAAYINGNGTKKPVGVLDATLGLTAGRFYTGAAGQTTAMADAAWKEMLAVKAKVNPIDRQVGQWLMHDSTAMSLYGAKDSQGRPIFLTSVREGESDTLLGQKVNYDPNMPVLAANAKAILYGNFKRAYRIRRVAGGSIQRLGELFALNRQVGYVVFKSLDGGVVFDEALAGWKAPAT
jgi:HK97 family phage major capsid protein